MKRIVRCFASISCGVLLGLGLMFTTNVAFGADDHVSRVLEENKTYEGFMNSDEVLSYEELVSMPGGSITNEAQLLQELKTKEKATLKSMGIPEKDINELKTKSVKELVLDNAASLSDTELLEKGLSQETVYNIKQGQYDAVSENDMMRAAANMAFRIGSAARAGTSCNYNIFWAWNSKPFTKYTDYVAGEISDGYWITGQSQAVITYSDEAGVLSDTTDRIYPVQATNDGVCFKFPMQKATSSGPRYCRAGKAFVATAGNYSPNGPLLANASYFHSWTPNGLTISVGYGPISYSGRGSCEGSATYHIYK